MQKRPKLRPTLQATYYSDQSVRLSIQDYLSEEHLLSPWSNLPYTSPTKYFWSKGMQ